MQQMRSASQQQKSNDSSSSAKIPSNLSQNSEVANYLNTTWVDMSVTDFDTLKWWKEHQSTVLILPRMGRDIPSVHVSTVSLEVSLAEKIIEDPYYLFYPRLV